MSEQFDNKIAVVTGAPSGIGRATALLLAERGAHVVAADIVADIDADADFTGAAWTVDGGRTAVQAG